MPTTQLPDTSPLRPMVEAFPRPGRVEWIGVRPVARAPVEVLDEVEAVVGSGLVGDHYAPRKGGAGTRQVTLVQAEHLPVIAALVGWDAVAPELLRRNLFVAGINLAALKGRRVVVGGAVLELVDRCTPCTLMEDVFGPGGYNAARGHGGWNARVVEGGRIAVGDEVRPET